VVISIEGKFQGGGIGEVSGAKIAGALEMVLEDCQSGHHAIPILLYDTGGVRLQEANYGLLAIAEICSAIVALRKYVPVVGVIPGKIGAFGGMSITAGLCSSIIMTKEGRLGLNGPEVIEQEAGIREFDSKDRKLIWRTIGGEQRTETGFADHLIEDDLDSLREVILSLIDRGTSSPRAEKINTYEAFLAKIDPEIRLSALVARHKWKIQYSHDQVIKKYSLQKNESMSRGRIWFDLLREDATNISNLSSLCVADHELDGKKARFISVVPDPENKFSRARNGELGLQEGWAIAKHVWEAILEDREVEKRAIIAIVDVPSQAYGYHEELLGIHQACAAAVNAYASARFFGHPVISFIPGNAISGAFLAHGMQANRLIALNDQHVNVHVMSKKSAARITQRSIEELERAAKKVTAMAYDIESFEKLGALFSLIDGVNADNPTDKDKECIYEEIKKAVMDVESSGITDLRNRLTSVNALNGGRTASIAVRKKLNEQWRM
ncbi:MAG TPA: biotin-independent malonate decarboxylase subunit gamma, partial [Metabacillus sp.]|nr:biotin-independent malonate decarboxylase subunit gamma [Metabacillus sp.]